MSRKWFITVLAGLLIIPFIGFMAPFKVGENPLASPGVEYNKDSPLLTGAFQNKVSEYLNDRILLHNQMVWVKTHIDLLFNTKEVNGVFITDKMLIKKPDLPTKEDCDKISNCITQFAMKTQKKVYTMIFPTSAQVNKNYLPSTVPKVDEGSLIGLVGQNFPTNVTSLDALTPLTSSVGQNAFYSTDSHITSYGAFCVYNYSIKQLGITPATLKDFNIQYGLNDYYGDLYAKTFYTGTAPDKVNLYHYNAKNIESTVTSYDRDAQERRGSLFDSSYLSGSESIRALAGGEAAVKVITTNADSNKQIVVFGDQNFDPLIQFLAIHYNKITVVDLNRLQKDDVKYVDLDGAEQVLFSYGIESLTSNDNFEHINWFLN